MITPDRITEPDFRRERDCYLETNCEARNGRRTYLCRSCGGPILSRRVRLVPSVRGQSPEAGFRELFVSVAVPFCPKCESVPAPSGRLIPETRLPAPDRQGGS